MDGKKNGFTLKPEAHKAHASLWNRFDLPPCLATPGKGKATLARTRRDTQQLQRTTDAKHLEPVFILDALFQFAAAAGRKALASLGDLHKKSCVDEHLTGPRSQLRDYLDSPARCHPPIRQRDNAQLQLTQLLSATKAHPPHTSPDSWAIQHIITNSKDPLQQLITELDHLEAHVRKAQEKFGDAARSSGGSSSPQKSPAKSKQAVKSTYEEVSHFYTHDLPSSSVPLLTALGLVSRLKASYAVVYCKDRSPTFPFRVAFQELCRIKAEAAKPQLLWDRMTLQPSLMRILRSLMEDRYHQEQEAEQEEE
jgi:hypothetical protein